MNLSKFIVFCLYFCIFWRDILAFIGVSTTITLLMLLAFTFFGFLQVIRNSAYGIQVNINNFIILVFSVLLWVFSVGKGIVYSEPLNLSNYYLAIPIAFIIVSLDVRFFFKVIALHLLLSILLSFYEVISSSYFYDYVASDGTVLDSNLFGGGLGVFRAKGLFQGPLSQVAIAYWICFIYRKKISAFILLLTALLSAGRLGLLVGTSFLIWRIIRPNSLPNINQNASSFRNIFLTLLAPVALYLIFLSFDDSKIIFISTLFDLTNPQTTSRFEFWGMSLNEFLKYDFASIIFGNYGYIQNFQGGTENDFLRIALDNGLMLLILYATIFSLMIFVSIKKKDFELFIIVTSVFVLMNVFPFIQSLSSTLMFWTLFLSILSKNKESSVNPAKFS